MNAVIHFIAPNGDSADVVIRLKSSVWHCSKNFRHVVQTGEFTWICCFEYFSSSEDSGACFPQEENIWMDKLIFLLQKITYDSFKWALHEECQQMSENMIDNLPKVHSHTYVSTEYP